MIKNVLTGFVFTLFLLNSSSAQDFSDVHDNLYEEAIYFLQGEKIIQGYEDNTFRPDQKINRAEFLKILIAANYADELDRLNYNEKCFDDIHNARDWYVPYACLAKKYGIIKGYDGNILNPTKNINFVEASKIIANVYENDIKEDSNLWYKNYVQFLLQNKLVPPKIQSFDHELTRAEMSEMITRAIKRESGKLEGYLDFRKTQYGEPTLPTWENFTGETAETKTKTQEVSTLTHSGEKITSGYITDYNQWTPANYDPAPNNDQSSNEEKASVRSKLLALLSEKRLENQVTPLRNNSKLEEAAQNFAEHLVINAFYSHTDLSGNDPFDRAKAVGYDGFVAESIVWKSSGPESAINWWQNSALHWKNIMGKDFHEAGIGVVKEPSGGYIIVLMTGQ